MIEVHLDMIARESIWGAEHRSIPFGPSTISAFLSSTFVARSWELDRSPDIGAARSGVAMFLDAEGPCSRRSAADHPQTDMAPAQTGSLFDGIRSGAYRSSP